MRASLRLLARRPAFRSLWAADFASQIGDWFSLVAVSIVSLESPSGGVVALATSLVAHLVPQALAAPFGGWLADRFDKRRVMLGGALVEGALTLAMLAVAAASNVLALQVLVAARSIASSAREPALGAALPRIVAEDELADANAFGAFTWSVAFAMGMSLGGIATSLGPAVALALDALSFAIAFVLLRSIPSLPPSREAEPGPGASEWTRSLEVVREALGPRLRGSVFGLSPMSFAAGCAWLSLNLAGQALPFLAGAATTVGFLQAVRGAGTAIGPLSIRWTSSALGGLDLGRPSAVAVVLGTLALAWSPSLAVATVGAVSWGAGSGALWMIMTSEIQTRAEDHVRGRMIALSGLGFTLSMSLGAVAAALMSSAGLPAVVCAGPLCALSVGAFLWLRGSGADARAPRELALAG